MTIYTPDTSSRHGPKYRVIADAIRDDIRNKTLATGTKLPTHRDLAYRLGVTVGTVTRAYAELQRSGVAGGKVGSGTYILDHASERQFFPVVPTAHNAILTASSDRAAQNLSNGNSINLSMNRPTPGPEADALAVTLGELSTADNLSILTQYNPAPGIDHHRAAIASLVGTVGLNADGEDMILTSGAQHGLAATVLGLLKSGDVLLTENLTYPGMTSLVAHVGARVHPVEMDEYGMRPDSLEAALRETGARVVYVVPVCQNPTTATMNMERLNAIAAIAKRHELLVIEDDVYGFQPERRDPPLAQLIPDNTIYISGFAKSISPGLRVGFIKSPKSLFSTLTRAVQITGWMSAPLMGEIATRWITSGIAQDIIAWHRTEMTTRNGMAAEILQGFDFSAKPESLHMWLRLPTGHNPDVTIRTLSQRGIVMAGPESFITTQSTVPRALRLCLGVAPSHGQLRKALEHIRSVLTAEPVQAHNLFEPMVM